ncbi:MAG: regulatory protein RecX [Peptococcaceae bacterium]|nr:regulatory protein RecX [Peptococcaceae bacterium]
MNISNYDKAMDCALRILAFKMRTEKELVTRLAKKGYEPEITLEVVERLKDMGYINDSAYAEAFVRSKVRRTGSLGLRYELTDKGVDKDLVRTVVEVNYPPDQELAAALELAEKIWRQCSECVPRNWQNLAPQELYYKKITKTARKLLSRGFSSTIVHTVMQKVAPECTEIVIS